MFIYIYTAYVYTSTYLCMIVCNISVYRCSYDFKPDGKPKTGTSLNMCVTKESFMSGDGTRFGSPHGQSKFGSFSGRSERPDARDNMQKGATSPHNEYTPNNNTFRWILYNGYQRILMIINPYRWILININEPSRHFSVDLSGESWRNVFQSAVSAVSNHTGVTHFGGIKLDANQ